MSDSTENKEGGDSPSDTQGQGVVSTSKSSKKRNRRKNKQNNNSDMTVRIDSLKVNVNEIELPGSCNISFQDIKKAMEVFSFQQKAAKTTEEALQKQYQFWSTQPVPKMDEKITACGPIEPDKPVSEIRQEPYSLPDGFMWDTLVLDDPLVLKELYTLLTENYVEDDDAMFRFDYPPQFLKWALQPPGWKKEWHCGVRVSKSGRLVGFISAIPAKLSIYGSFSFGKSAIEVVLMTLFLTNFFNVHRTYPRDDENKAVLMSCIDVCKGSALSEKVFGHASKQTYSFMSLSTDLDNKNNCVQSIVEINFLCVHKKLRSKRVAPVLIREITRRVNLTGVFQAVYTAGVVLPKPVGTCRYWHRSLNPKKLIEVKFSHLSRNMTMQRTLKLYKLPEQTKTPGFRKLTPADLPKAKKLLTDYLSKFDLAPVFSDEEVRYWFLPQPGIVDAFVVEVDGEVTDLVSYYTLPSTVMHHPVYRTLKAAYSFYNVSTKTPWIDLMTDALISAKNAGFDVFNALDLMDNKEFLEALKFGIGDGNLQYYLFNWRCPSIPPNKIGLVLQ